MTKVFGGRHTYGEAIGIIMMNKYKPRIPGDVGNASTFNFPVRYRVVEEATGDAHRRADRLLVEPFIKAAQELARDGVKAITSSCGFLAFYHREIANAVDIPVFVSSLIQVPMVCHMLGRNRKVGVLTAEAKYLDERHFEAVGAKGLPVVVYGMEDQPEFCRVILRDERDMDHTLVEQEVVSVCKAMVQDHPDVGAIVFECANLPPYAAAVNAALRIPVFDLVTLTNMMFQAVVRKPIVGFM